MIPQIKLTKANSGLHFTVGLGFKSTKCWSWTTQCIISKQLKHFCRKLPWKKQHEWFLFALSCLVLYFLHNRLIQCHHKQGGNRVIQKLQTLKKLILWPQFNPVRDHTSLTRILVVINTYGTLLANPDCVVVFVFFVEPQGGSSTLKWGNFFE